MPEIDILGIAVDFPYEAHDTQLRYMQKVISALKRGANALLESPTGTGKTLCLLCACLGWLRACKAALQAPAGTEIQAELCALAGLSGTGSSALETIGAFLGSGGSKGKDRALPRIIYSSRTHGQLSQVVGELSKTTYRPRVSVLGSREHLCVHEEIKHLRGPAQIGACRTAVSNRECRHKLQTDKQTRELVHQVHAEPRDIEDLAKVIAAAGSCPFFVAREAQLEAELVLVPYHYVLDPATRDSMAIDMLNDIVIFDEGHNLLEACSDQWSFDINPALLRTCSSTLTAGADVLDANISKLGHTAVQADSKTSTELNERHVIDGNALRRLAEQFATLQSLVEEIETPSENVTTVKKLEARHFLHLLAEAGFDRETFPNVKIALELAASEITSSKTTSHLSITALRVLTDALRVMLGPGTTPEIVEQDYAFVVHPKDYQTSQRTAIPASQPLKRKSKSWFAPRGTPKPEEERSTPTRDPNLSAWCMNPGLSMQDMVGAGVRSIVLTSGTLSPLEAFATEMRIPFAVKFENSHVITNSQIAVGVIPKGPGGVSLDSRYSNRDSQDYKKDLGRTLVNLTKVLPGGFLVFFPSYGVMKRNVEFWKSPQSGKSSIWSELQRNKRVLMESQDGAALNELLESHERNVKDYDGSCLFAVCRGRVSEGIDFSDERGRTVVITGLPYASVKDPRVTLKKTYMDVNRSQLKISGGTWYNIQAMRAVNQAVGRIIRHRNDYGAVILADQRFASESHAAMLSQWLVPHFKVFDNYGCAHGYFNRFLKQAATMPFAQIKARPARKVDPQAQKDAKTQLASLIPRKHGLDERTAGYMADAKHQKLERDTSRELLRERGKLVTQPQTAGSLGAAPPTVSTDARGSSRGSGRARSEQEIARYADLLKERLGQRYSEAKKQLEALKLIGKEFGSKRGTLDEKDRTRLWSICERLVRAFSKSSERAPLLGDPIDPLLQDIVQFLPGHMAPLLDQLLRRAHDNRTRLDASVAARTATPKLTSREKHNATS